MIATLADQIALEELSSSEYISKVLPERMGNLLPIAYGGCALGLATHAASKTVPPAYSLYSLVGHFLGPASTNEKMYCTVFTTRDTRTFATRRVQVSQVHADGKRRVCLELLADFQVQEAALLTYSKSPTRAYSGPDQSSSVRSMAETAVSEGKMSKKAFEEFQESFKLGETFFETKFCPEGVSGQNVMGAVKKAKTTQDHLPITEKTTGDWVRSRKPLETRGERMAGIAFLLDGALSFIPLSHSHMWLDDSGACSTLDFALRIFVPDIAIDSWHLRERITAAGGIGRTYTEARLWDEQGTLVASMTQQSIMRPKPDGKPKTRL